MHNVMNLEQPALIGLEVKSLIGTKPAPCKTSQSLAATRICRPCQAMSSHTVRIKRSDNTRHTVLVSYLYAVTSFPLITSWLRQSGLDFDIIHEGLEVNVVAKIIMSYTRIKWPSSLCGTISFFSSQTSLYSVRGEQRLL